MLDVGWPRQQTWLDTYAAWDSTNYLGMGDRLRDGLQILAERFRVYDFTTPLDLERKFDLVQSLRRLNCRTAFRQQPPRSRFCASFGTEMPFSSPRPSKTSGRYWAPQRRDGRTTGPSCSDEAGYATYDWFRFRRVGRRRAGGMVARAEHKILFVREGVEVEPIGCRDRLPWGHCFGWSTPGNTLKAIETARLPHPNEITVIRPHSPVAARNL